MHVLMKHKLLFSFPLSLFMIWYTATTPSPNTLQFSDPASTSDTALASFHPLVFLYFMLSFYLVPYPIYRLIAKKYDWEVNKKSIARHWSDTMLAFSYGVILFIFGNYTKVFSWITVIAFYPSLFGYALIAEQPYTKTSLPNIKQWPKGMWVVFLVALAVILAFAGVHIYFASILPLPFVIYYVCALCVPLFFLFVAVLLIKEVNQNWIRTRYYKDEEKANPYSNTISLHIHHWQIFYVLAFLLVAAGIVLACYMQGICAYGYDPLVNDN
ncbi:uncharacterized protein B0P05DRAFT_544373 [Gilbertella persicaria]|uniref:uncharacterized protein n=1 Tax=Gilbertella persicaria TaxID=101096 RepID=UPI00221EF93D|nr:uncharacterized protein B0P05DRAFT_544373 [Gilbertella persicaria]KAI8077282.1 hypothetical protein B0P05DRAFT_544373 [Gilbertella persicaria]